jgi:NAD(P)H dehydrogenase (quinone)
MTTYALTGATGQLGAHTIALLADRVGAENVVALARDPARLAGWAAKGVRVREADYDRPETLGPALKSVDRLLLIAGNAVGERVGQHSAVIDAAKVAGVGLIVYTSILHAPDCPIALADDHRATEALLAASGVPHALMRHGWYADNYTAGLAAALASGQILGCAGGGRISAASRADMAAGDCTALITAKGGEVYEIAGDCAFTMTEFAAEVARQAGKAVAYVDLSQADYVRALEDAGLPGFVARMFGDSSHQTSKDVLHDTSGDLARLIGRPTEPVAQVIARALANL